MYSGQEELDSLVWDKNDDDYDESLKQMRLSVTCQKVEQLTAEKFGVPAHFVSPIIVGGFNILYRMRLEQEHSDVMVRLPIPSLVQFPEEKTVQEAATAAYIAENTQVPVPKQLFYHHDSPVGPFIIMQRVEFCGSLSARTTTRHEDPNEAHTLDANFAESTLEVLWTKVASCYLQLAQLSFPRIGSLVPTETGSFEILGRPITHTITDMVRLANIPRAVLPQPDTTYATADEWLTTLAEMHLATLIFQHNDLVETEDDCRNKYVARQVFRRLAKQGKLSTFGFAEDNWSAQFSEIPNLATCPAPSSEHSFKLWGDDLRAGNILLTESDDIAAVIDWEYTYAGPSQFILDPPWWLLLETAEMWSEGIDDWLQMYEKRLKTWISAMRHAERAIADPSPFPLPLSAYMQESWDTGRFWLNYGARKCWAFDMVYWRFLDERFFGKRPSDTAQDDLWKTRVHLLTDEEREAMEPFVQRKLKDSEERIIVGWDPVEARVRFNEFLFE
ncbi:hypothetical protein HJFPF1_09794 [Paramyrothecium foliicola]|nr:hypothetical protein HJFPF1_09794 [Paramyrothecium foliicola]